MDLGSLLIMIGLIVVVVAFLARPVLEDHVQTAAAEDHRLSALQAEREAIVTMIREIEMDHAVGKVSDDDFREQRAALVARGAGVLRELDALGGGAPDEIDKAIEAAVAARRGRAAPGGRGVCSHCGRALQRGDRFCASCGTPVHKERGG